MSSRDLFTVNLSCIKKAVDEGADINFKLGNTTPLIHAIDFADRKIVEYLIKKGADLQAVSFLESYGYTRSPLVVCQDEADANDIMKMLLEYGANPNQAETKTGYTPLTKALDSKNEQLIQLLMKHGADVNFKDSKGRLPLAMAIEHENLGLINQFLNEGAEFSVQKVFQGAIKVGNFEILQLLIERGANVKLRSVSGETPLTCALKIGNPEIAQLLIDSGADVNLPDASGDAPLTQAIKPGRLRLMRCLIEAGADLDVIGSDGRSPLTAAVEEWDFDLVLLLLDRKVDVNRRDGNEKSPFSVAVAVENLRIAKYLQERGARIDDSLPEIEELCKRDEDWKHHFADLIKQ